MTHELKRFVKFVFFIAWFFSTINFLIIYQQIVMTISNLFYAYFYLIIGLVFLTIPGILVISVTIEKIGVYHRNFSEKCILPQGYYDFLREDEKHFPFQINFSEMFLCYLILSIPLFFIFMYILDPANFFDSSYSSADVTKEFLATLAIIPFYVFSIRILSNPTKKRYWGLVTSYYQAVESKYNLKREILSFFFAITATSYFVMIIQLLYKSFSFGNDFISYWSTFSQLFVKTFIPQLSELHYVVYIFAYLLALFIGTAIVEMILQHFEPTDTT